LNDEEHCHFFNAIFHHTTADLFEFVHLQSFPELSDYFEGVLADPPYQKLLLDADAENVETRHYEDLAAIYSIQYHSRNKLSHVMSCSLFHGLFRY
jgi:16S rRNA G966 N2-methylase RsmD